MPRTRASILFAAALLAAGASLPIAPGSASSSGMAGKAPGPSSGSLSDTTGMAGSRPGCVPVPPDSAPTVTTGDVRPPDAAPSAATGDVRAPRIIDDWTVGSGQTAETGIGGNSSQPRSATTTGKTGDC